jgi:hypothetical protein
MYELLYGPSWFAAGEGIIEGLSAFVVLLIAFFAWRYYTINPDNKNYLIITVSFALMAAAFVAKAISHAVIPGVLSNAQPGINLVTAELLHNSPNFFTLFLGYRFLLIYALFLLYVMYQGPSRMNHVLIAFLLFVTTYFSRSSYSVYHLTALMLTGFIMYTYFLMYQRNKHPVTRLLFVSFFILAWSRLFYLLVSVKSAFYVVAEVLQLMAFILLLYTFMGVVRHGKKAITA